MPLRVWARALSRSQVAGRTERSGAVSASSSPSRSSVSRSLSSALLPPTGFVAGLVLLAIAQGADTVSSIFRHTILQLETPDALRGRLSAINLVFVAGGPQLGQVESGVVADLWSPEASVVSGGLACVGMVFVAHALAPEVARYRADLQHGPATG